MVPLCGVDHFWNDDDDDADAEILPVKGFFSIGQKAGFRGKFILHFASLSYYLFVVVAVIHFLTKDEFRFLMTLEHMSATGCVWLGDDSGRNVETGHGTAEFAAVIISWSGLRL